MYPESVHSVEASATIEGAPIHTNVVEILCMRVLVEVVVETVHCSLRREKDLTNGDWAFEDRFFTILVARQVMYWVSAHMQLVLSRELLGQQTRSDNRHSTP